MLHKTRGIVLKTINHRETSVICQIFTEKFGLQSYIINGAKRRKAKIPINILQPLHLLDMVVYHKENSGLQRVSEAKQTPVFQSIPYDDKKRSVVIFLNEILSKCLKQQSADEPIFEYIYHSILWLDQSADASSNYHLYFLMRFSKFMGFYPSLLNGKLPYFDLKEGVFCRNTPYHQLYLNEKQTQQWLAILSSSFQDLHEIRISTDDRRAFLNNLLDYYALHVDNFGSVKSHYILEEVFD